jgi:hypothetical protein
MRLRAYIIRISLMFFCFLLIFPSAAQEFITGIKVGYSTSKFTGSAITNSNHYRMPGINIGGILNKPFRKFDLQSELLISTKGYQINSIGDTYISNLLIYIDLPLLIKKKTFARNDFGIFTIDVFQS